LKRQELLTTKASKYIAVAAAVIAGVEDVWDESFDLLSVPIPWWLESPWETLAEVEKARDGRLEVEVGVPEKGHIFEDYLDDLDLTVEIVGDPELRFSGGWTLRNLYKRVPLSPLSLDSEIIRSLAIETTKSGVEYMMLYLKTGSLVLLEGEHFRVSVPLVSFSRVIYHTHPHGACGLSLADIKSTAEFLVNGGLGGAAATDSCASYMLRLGFVCEDDFISLKKLKDPVILGRGGPRLRSVEFGFVSY